MHILYTKRKGDIVGYVLSFLAGTIVLIIVFSFGFLLGHRDYTAQNTIVTLEKAKVFHVDAEDRLDFGLFWKAWDLLKAKHVDQDVINAQDLLYGAISGMYAATDDPYTLFFTPDESKMFEEALEGSFEGIGAEVGLRDNFLTIITPLDDSPAEQAGLRSGDKVIEIDHENVIDLSIDESVSRMRGPKGTDVVLTIFRDGNDDTQDITITRDKIVLDSVRTEILENNIAYIRVAQFGTTTAQEFESELQKAHAQGVQGIIVDMRNNPGGFLNAAVEMVGNFLPTGSTAVIEENADGVKHALKTGQAGKFVDVPVVILINQGSASASEIFAGALRDDRDDVVLVGEKSFGKGSVQEYIAMTGGASSKITVAKWLTPDEKHIDGEGITPDVVIEYTEEDYKADKDPQKDEAIKILREKITARARE